MLITKLAELPERTVLDEAELADVLGVQKRTVRRMVQRGELPPPVRFGGRSTWQIGGILRHYEARADKAARDAERQAVARARHVATL